MLRIIEVDRIEPTARYSVSLFFFKKKKHLPAARYRVTKIMIGCHNYFQLSRRSADSNIEMGRQSISYPRSAVLRHFEKHLTSFVFFFLIQINLFMFLGQQTWSAYLKLPTQKALRAGHAFLPTGGRNA